MNKNTILAFSTNILKYIVLINKIIGYNHVFWTLLNNE